MKTPLLRSGIILTGVAVGLLLLGGCQSQKAQSTSGEHRAFETRDVLAYPTNGGANGNGNTSANGNGNSARTAARHRSLAVAHQPLRDATAAIDAAAPGTQAWYVDRNDSRLTVTDGYQYPVFEEVYTITRDYERISPRRTNGSFHQHQVRVRGAGGVR